MPKYKYEAGSPGSDLCQNRDEYEKAVGDHLEKDICASQVKALFDSAGGGSIGTVRYVSLPATLPVEFWPFLDYEIGIGNVTFKGYIHFLVEKVSVNEYRIFDVRSVLTCEDLWDYNYFNPSPAALTGFPQAAASVQAGFGKCGNPPNAGGCFVISYETDRIFSGSNAIDITKVVSP